MKTKQSPIRRLFSLSLSFCLFFLQVSPAMGQEDIATSTKLSVQEQAKVDAEVNQERFEKYDGANNTRCTPSQAAQQRYDQYLQDQEELREKNLSGINRLREGNKLNALFGISQEKDAAVSGQAGKQIDADLIARQQVIFAKAEAREKVAAKKFAEAQALEQKKKQEYEAAQTACGRSILGGFGCTPGSRAWRVAKEKEIEYRKAQAARIAAANELHAARRAAYNAAHAVAHYRNIRQNINSATADVRQNEKKANAASAFSEKRLSPEYDRYLTLLDQDTAIAVGLAEETSRKVAELELQLTNPADYELFDIALNGTSEQRSFQDTRATKIFVKNVDVVSMAGAAVKDLRCGFGGSQGYLGYNQLRFPTVDINHPRDRGINVKSLGGEDWSRVWSIKYKSGFDVVGGFGTSKAGSDEFVEVKRWTEVDSRAYHMLRAASATYLIGQMTENNAYQEQVNCMAEEKFDEGNADYDGKNNEQVASIERATNLLDEIVTNVCSKVTPDQDHFRDNPDTYKRLVKACGEKGYDNSSIRTRENALIMYQTAYELALGEVAKKRELVAKADAMVKQGEARIKAKEQAIKATKAIVAALYMIYRVLKSNPKTKPAAPPFFAAAKAASIFWSFSLAKGLEKAIDFKVEWLNRKEQAMVHTHLSCNYEKAISVIADHRKQAKEIESNVRQEVDQARETALEGKTSFYHHERGIKFAYDQSLDRAFRRSIMMANSQYEAQSLTHDWIRHLEGARSSRPYDSDLLIQQEKLDQKLESWGFSFVKKLKDSSIAIANFVLGKAHASTPSNGAKDDLDHSQRFVGIADGGTAFMFFIENKDAHWADFATHAYKHRRDRNIREGVLGLTKEQMREMIVDVDAANTEGHRIVGMPVPETREKHLASIVSMVTENLLDLNNLLAQVVDERDKLVHLLKRSKTQLSLGVTGVDEEDNTPELKTKGICLKQDSTGDFVADPNCGCSATNSCANFSYPKFGEIGAVSNASHAQLALDAANGTLKGKLGAGNIAAAELSKNAKATRERIRQRQNSINLDRQSRNLDPIDFDRQARENLNRQRESFARSIVENKDSLTNTFGGADDLALTFKNINRDRLLGKTSATNNKKTGDQVLVASVSKAEGISSNSTNPKKGGVTDFQKEAEVLDFSLDEDEAEGEATALEDLDIDGEMPEETNGLIGEGQFSDQEGKGSQEVDYQNNSYSASGRAGNYHKRRRYGKQQINRNKNSSIFNIITKRYKRTAYPIFLKKIKL